MILASVRFLANRHILLVIGDLRETESEVKSANLGPNGVLQLPLMLAQLSHRDYRLNLKR